MFHGRGAVGHVAHGQNAVRKEKVSVLKEVMAAVAPAHGQNAVRKERVSVLKEVMAAVAPAHGQNAVWKR